LDRLHISDPRFHNVMVGYGGLKKKKTRVDETTEGDL
jgi:hypothetical protein